MKKRIFIILLLFCYSLKSEGYFLNFKQKGQLLSFGHVSDNDGNTYNILICPGYFPPLKSAVENFGQAGENLGEYFEKNKYKLCYELMTGTFSIAFSDLFLDFTIKGSGRSWKKKIEKANKRVKKRVIMYFAITFSISMLVIV